MKIKYNELKKVIKEELVSPQLFAQEPRLNIVKELDNVVAKFESTALTSLLFLGADEHFNKQTKDYDNAAYQRAKATTTAASKQLRTKLAAALKEAWGSMHTGAETQSGPVSNPNKKAV